jgi:LysR family transcriptional regulator, hydrogen peroxide-inducible genes activator
MELHQLRYAIAVADTGNFTRAAQRSHVSQPSLSQQIINLEKEVGHKLFHRLGRKAVLTEAGSVFLDRARKILFEVESVSKELSDHPALGRRITVGAIPTVAPYLLPELIRRCAERHPNLQIDVREDFRSHLMHAVIEGELDLAVAALPVKDHRLSVEPLFTEPLLLVVGKDHAFARQPIVQARDLANETFVLLGSSSSLATQIQSFCGDHHVEPRVGARCAQVATVKALVGLGVGVSILPRVAQSPDDKKNLVYITLADSTPMRELVVVRHLQRYQSRGAEQFLGLLREMTGEGNNQPRG